MRHRGIVALIVEQHITLKVLILLYSFVVGSRVVLVAAVSCLVDTAEHIGLRGVTIVGIHLILSILEGYKGIGHPLASTRIDEGMVYASSDSDEVALHIKKNFLFLSVIPDLEEYLKAQIRSFFKTAHILQLEIEKCRMQEYEKQV